MMTAAPIAPGWTAPAEGETIETRFEPGSYGEHELLDRTSFLLESWNRWITTHPATLIEPERSRRAHQIAELIADFYQLVGRADAE